MLNHLTFSHKPKSYTNTAKTSVAVSKSVVKKQRTRQKNANSDEGRQAQKQ